MGNTQSTHVIYKDFGIDLILADYLGVDDVLNFGCDSFFVQDSIPAFDDRSGRINQHIL